MLKYGRFQDEKMDQWIYCGLFLKRHTRDYVRMRPVIGSKCHAAFI